MISRHHKEDLFIAEYTLGLLEPEQLAQAHSLLGHDDEAAASALQWEARLLDLTDALTPLRPSDQLLNRIQATLGLPLEGPATATPASSVSQASLRSETQPFEPARRPVVSTPSPPAPADSALDFEPRLIRPDAAPTAAPAPVPESRAQSIPAQSKPQAAKTAPQSAAATAPTRVRAAPPDPMEAFRPAPGAHKPPRQAMLRSLWFWRALSAALAILAAVLALPKDSFRHDPALSASLQPPAAPTTQIVQVAVMQAPGTSSTPGWILTVDSRQNVVLDPQVEIAIPETESVYLWTYNEHSPNPRLLGLVDPVRSLTLPIEVTGEVSPGQIFEMTQEPNLATPRTPEGPILFIGRTIKLG